MSDFLLEDAWQFPVTLEPHHTLEEFKGQMQIGMKELMESGLPGILFKIRLSLGKVLGWDSKPKILTESDGSLRAKYARLCDFDMSKLPPLTGEDFEPVYNLPEESLSEINNATVHAALHLGMVAIEDNKFTIQMGVYVKPKGAFGKIYMSIIKLPRHWIVYPALLKKVGKKWSEYVG